MLGPGVRDPVPAAADGGALQEVLQHVRVTGRLHRGVRRQAVWRYVEWLCTCLRVY